MSSQEPPTYSELYSNQPKNLSGTNNENNPTVQVTINSAIPYSKNIVELEYVKRNSKYLVRFHDASIRAGFIRKVVFLVTIMIGVAAIMTAIPFLYPDLKKKVQDTPALCYVSYGIFLVVYAILFCSESLRVEYPSNLICAGILTLSFGYMTMMITSMYEVEFLLLIFVITTILCASIILFSTQTKYDLHSIVGYLFIASMCVLIIGIVTVISIVVFKVHWQYTLLPGIMPLFFMFYLAVDIQMMLSGKKPNYDPEDYLIGAITIFMDIIFILVIAFSNDE